MQNLLSHKIKDRRIALTNGNTLAKDKVLSTYNLQLSCESESLKCKSFTALLNFAKSNQILKTSSLPSEPIATEQNAGVAIGGGDSKSETAPTAPHESPISISNDCDTCHANTYKNPPIQNTCQLCVGDFRHSDSFYDKNDNNFNSMNQ